MKDNLLELTVLGCGSSGGVPRLGMIGGDWGDCDPKNPKNRRSRCALLITHKNKNYLIDSGPDFRAQMIENNVLSLEALLITHEHADHIHGIDDMRLFVNSAVAEETKRRAEQPGFFYTRALWLEMMETARIPCYAGLSAYDDLRTRFGYLFETRENGLYPPIMHLNKIKDTLDFEGLGITPFAVPHGEIDAYGFAFHGVVYTPDLFDLTDEARALIQDCKLWIVDCLQFREHKTHANYERVMEWIKTLAPQRVILTNLHSVLDYDALDAMTPDHVTPAYDGMRIKIEI